MKWDLTCTSEESITIVIYIVKPDELKAQPIFITILIEIIHHCAILVVEREREREREKEGGRNREGEKETGSKELSNKRTALYHGDVSLFQFIDGVDEV